MRRDAFTLIELLIVMGILIGIVGVAMLSLTDFRREAEFRAVADRLESIGELARAEALRQGQPVELILREPSGTRPMRVLTRRLDPVLSASTADRGQEREPTPARARTELPRWLVVFEDDESGARVSVPDAGEATETRLAVFMVDGSALAAQAVTLEDSRSGAQLMITIDGLTGVCRGSIDWNPADDGTGASEVVRADDGADLPERGGGTP